ncbi:MULTISPECIES: threonine--tRNA ligase [Carboxydocella]|uniref:Threonine--tRNA ligase n=2 Tax=Carboxydocella TaxID=178898 RepID=A0A1T4Q0N2_9FIRM|nr:MULTISPECIES: threonine--tRNA ligase [Carboxydocella]AVX21237.1 threonyl-tRNA synthetase [Carboxydocella thermautotrophica]AVX31669.1 threonyl-tRNA synthetase [Carboxydocella thermautotrophica]SJZ97136.1 threonyl-tRNA synthetase [Carboxydocella sporoproducens DSM 16521]GAW29283.1 threonine--tRNA ligase [Carboxydocella sp. ULO1]GAW32060.1 threonine--tRNA ligase [Carboxydocella sp. JDF658]
MAEQLEITLKDGSVREYPQGTTVAEVAASIGRGLAKAALAGKMNDRIIDLHQPLPGSGALEIITAESPEALEILRHSAAHIMAAAVQKLYPGTKFGIGPAIADGFYYDFDSPHTFTPEDFAAIEAEMARLVKEDLPFIRKEISREEALALFGKRGEIYKVEIINDLPEDAVISIYQVGDFVDLCAGPHLPSSGRIKAFKIMSIAGAYWRGSEKNKMLQRLYATAFFKKEDLEQYLFRLEEAKRRDHRKIGQELKLFDIMDEGPGFPFFFPKGMIIRNELESFWREEHRKAGYQEIRTPIILNRQLWERSGHWAHYKENMYFTKIDDEDYAVKPMNCPGAILVYRSQLHSYRDLPLRYGEMGLVHRHEKSGVLHGLMRVRCFTQDDAHIFMLPEQIKDEILGVIELIDKFYSTFGFEYKVELSTRPEDSMGSDEIWELATSALREALEARGMEYKVNEGDGAFYGPKIDFHLKDCLGRTWQCGTIQLDFQMPEKFDLTYVGEDGQKHRPVMIHRVVFGSIERFIGILTEHFAGAFPVWLAPVQVKLLTVTDRARDYAVKLYQQLQGAGIRVELDDRNEKIGYKIREAQLEKVPYMLVLGDREVEAGTVAVRRRGQGDLGSMTPEELQERVLLEIREKALD